jgi:hypothetical protein
MCLGGTLPEVAVSLLDARWPIQPCLSILPVPGLLLPAYLFDVLRLKRVMKPSPLSRRQRGEEV